MKRKIFIFLLAAVFCVNTMTVFAESEKIEQEGNTEYGEIKDTAQTSEVQKEKGMAEADSETSDIITSLKKEIPKIGGGGRQKEEF